MNSTISLYVTLILVSSGAISSVLLTAGYYLPSLLVVAFTACVIILSERRGKSFREILQDKPVY
jgi:uncharacterized membrane protein YoaK (UPF0700 family)